MDFVKNLRPFIFNRDRPQFASLYKIPLGLFFLADLSELCNGALISQPVHRLWPTHLEHSSNHIYVAVLRTSGRSISFGSVSLSAETAKPSTRLQSSGFGQLSVRHNQLCLRPCGQKTTSASVPQNFSKKRTIDNKKQKLVFYLLHQKVQIFLRQMIERYTADFFEGIRGAICLLMSAAVPLSMETGVHQVQVGQIRGHDDNKTVQGVPSTIDCSSILDKVPFHLAEETISASIFATPSR